MSEFENRESTMVYAHGFNDGTRLAELEPNLLDRFKETLEHRDEYGKGLLPGLNREPRK